MEIDPALRAWRTDISELDCSEDPVNLRRDPHTWALGSV